MQRVTITIDEDLVAELERYMVTARLRKSLRGNTRSSAIRPAATCCAGRGAATVSCRSNIRRHAMCVQVAIAAH